jgi:hypothetical protein
MCLLDLRGLKYRMFETKGPCFKTNILKIDTVYKGYGFHRVRKTLSFHNNKLHPGILSTAQTYAFLQIWYSCDLCVEHPVVYETPQEEIHYVKAGDLGGHALGMASSDWPQRAFYLAPAHIHAHSVQHGT